MHKQDRETMINELLKLGLHKKLLDTLSNEKIFGGLSLIFRMITQLETKRKDNDTPNSMAVLVLS